MTKHRFRIRFSKTGDLRLISHRDLARAFERLLRRAGVALRMSQGFHPKPRISFPSALALGICGMDEVMEVELAEPTGALQLKDRLAQHAPPGLTILSVTARDEGQPKAQPILMTYEFPVPPPRHAAVDEAVARVLAAATLPIRREGREEPIDLVADLDSLTRQGDVLHMRLRATRTAGTRPRDVLAVLGLDDLEQSGSYLTRTAVEVGP